MADDSETKITLTMWGDSMCSKYDLKTGDIIALKGARVSRFGGKSLNASDDHCQLFKEGQKGIDFLKT